MTTILLVIALLLIIIKYLIFLDVILSWLTIFWLNVRPKFLSEILDPLYSWIKSKISTSIWPLDFTPIIIYILAELLVLFIYWLDSNVSIKINNLSAFLNF